MIERSRAWERVRRRNVEEVPQYYPKKDWQVMVLTDASDLAWEGAVTQVPKEDVSLGILIEDRYHEPSGFVSAIFRGAQLLWLTVIRRHAA